MLYFQVRSYLLASSRICRMHLITVSPARQVSRPSEGQAVVVVVVVVFFTLTDRASTIPSNIHTWCPESTECGRCYAFRCMVATRGGYRMARGWHYAKLSLSNARRLSFSGICIFILVLFPLSFLFVFSFALIGSRSTPVAQ